MAVTIKVKSRAERASCELAANRVVSYFGSCLPAARRLLCYLDDEDPPDLRRELGRVNRGLYGPINDNTQLAMWPTYVVDCILVDDGVSIPYPRVVDDLIYLYGSSCADEVGLTMTLAHELQHAIQHANAGRLWAVNSLISRQLDGSIIQALKLKWTDIPIEVEARIVSKRVAVTFFGEQRVEQYIDQKIAERLSENDVADWQFVRSLTPLSSVDLVEATHQLFQRVKPYKSESEWALRRATRDNPEDYRDVDLEPFFAQIVLASFDLSRRRISLK